MKLLFLLITYLMAMPVSFAANTLELSTKDALLLSLGLMEKKEYDQSLKISLAIYEQRKKDYVVAGILSMKAYIQTNNTKHAVLIGDDIDGAVQSNLVMGNESLSDWDAKVIDYFYWTFVKYYASALYLEKRNGDAIPFFRKLISHSEQAGEDAFLFQYSLADSCMEIGDFQCAENSYIQLLKASKNNVEYGKYEKKIYYNLACTAAELGEYNKAKDYLLNTGWKWEKLEKLIAGDNDLKGFRDSEYFEQLRLKVK